MFEEAWKFPNPWGVDDYLMWTREIQGVKCDGGIFAQDHTFDVLKNYSQRNGAAALWDVATDTGEVACAVLVRSTKTRDFAHAAEQLSRRLHFQPAAMYADTWPHKSTFWPILFGKDMQGRLGLFHFIQRITRTLRKNHIDYNLAINKLLQSVYPYHSEDYEQLLAALKDGSMTGEKVTSGEIKQMQKGKTFRQRYNQYHRKVIKPAETMRQCLDDWFCNFKVTASEGRPDPGGRLDPKTQQPLFTAETKEAVDNCKKNAEVIGDPLPIEKMYREVKANPRSLHQLSTWISRRPESKLESFHDSLSHFGNCGMGSTLCDSLNLCGTARYNLNIRHKLRLSQMSKAQRIKIPALWEEVVSYLNHCELAYVNALARDAGTDHVPFKDTEILVADTGERFFSKYLEEVPTQQEVLDWCQCHKCAANEIPLWHESAATSRKWEKTTMTAPPTAPLSPKQKENRQSFPVDAPLRQSNNPGQQLVPEQPQQQWHVKKLVQPPIQPNFTYIPHETITMWPTQGVTFQPMTWIPPQLPQQQMSLPPFPWMAPQQPQQQMYHACTVPKHKFCCSRYYLWYSNHNRKGRPPHEHQCRDRMQSKREMCLGQEQTSAKLKHLFSVCFSKELFLNFAATCTS
ncbi:hypothetical protein IV203_002294 [Nitzschia inconspicua]|nr:hypothetical protein IV203_002294 [Nitzschia inconspicua]